ncbi:MAG: o-succinylbenzoate--CoA ligase [Candidatus Hydrogenedentes bacterium]|nr:o-succinylbenzoate--CoA ligase [Candidatus Hydrogenedentota bacterium]
MHDLVWPLINAARERGNLPALVSAAQTYTFASYDAAAHAVACALRATGIQAGERVCLLSLPSPEVPIVLMGAFRAGLTVCLLNTRMPRHGLAEAIHRVRPRVLIVDDYFARMEFGHLPNLRIASILDAEVADARIGAPDLSLPGTIIFTSGSSAEPKAALHTCAQHSYSALASNENIVIEPGDCWLLSLPLFHVSGLGILFRSAWAGGAVAVPEQGEPLDEAIKRYGVTHVSLVATQLFRLLHTRSGKEALASLKAILVGGGAVPGSLVREAHRQRLPLFTTYGLTEMASQVTTTRPWDPLEVLLTSGRPLRPDTIRVSDSGEIEVRGPTLFSGYVEDEAISLPQTEDGWFATGDLGKFDESGNLHLLGRRDNLFVSGGENIQPEEIERCLCHIDGVVEAVVVPVKSEEFGSRPVAFVRVAEPQHMKPALFAAYLAERLPAYKIPMFFLPWPVEKGEEPVKVSRTALAHLAGNQVLDPPAEGQTWPS